MKSRPGWTAGLLLAAVAIVLSCSLMAPASHAEQTSPKTLVAIPPDKDSDLKFYDANGTVLNGIGAMEKMPGASLRLWVAGNQFFAMDEVIEGFQKIHPGLTVGLLTLPPGLILSAILGNGWTYQGKEFTGLPDLYASVSLGHLQQLAKAGLMNDYAIYMHNELRIMVAKNNPKNIMGIDDLVRPDVRTSLPNPVSEGIMQFYARPVLERHGIWDRISNGKICASCQTTDNNWFTAVHHRETPQRILDNKSDAGIVWKTEVLEATRHGSQIELGRVAAERQPARRGFLCHRHSHQQSPQGQRGNLSDLSGLAGGAGRICKLRICKSDGE